MFGEGGGGGVVMMGAFVVIIYNSFESVKPF